MQQTITAKLWEQFQGFQTDVHPLDGNGTKITTEKGLTQNQLEIENSCESNNEDKTIFAIFLHICYPFFNP